jgi:dTDP-4-amino-4,6-dideoxygalactose transaminase
MLEMQAVIGRIQLKRMADWTAKRQAHTKALALALQPFVGERGVLRVPNLACGGCAQGCGVGGYKACAQGCVHALYKFYAYVCPQNLAQGWSRDRMIEAFNAEGVPCYQGSCSEVYLEKAFDGTGWRPQQRLAVAQELGETSLMFLVHPTLTPADMAKTTTAMQKILKEAQA